LTDGFWDNNPPHGAEALSGSWRSGPKDLCVRRVGYFIIVEGVEAHWVEDFLFDTGHSILQLYRTVYKANHSVYQYKDQMTEVAPAQLVKTVWPRK